ncbi:hypothetical protein C8J57DRAFT_1432212 [Mycena rebaudengoi]|nr:hypothetical protein C8J57DRAFT_1432212 [Mycena rebaudengoi]
MSSSHTSFNRWRGISSLDNFDDFFGDDDFDGFRRRNQVIVRDHDLVCHSRRVAIIQQRLAVLQEMTKRIITEQICDVETQTIVFEQHHSSLGRFQNDLRRHSGFRVGFDRNIESHFRDFFDSDGSFTTHDFGFRGRDIGRETIVIKDNWDDERSPQSVESAFYESRNAYYFNHFNI